MFYCIILAVIELGTLARRFERLLVEDAVIWRGAHIDNYWVLGYSWVVIMLFRQAWSCEKNFKTSHRKSVLSLLTGLRSRHARAARNTGLAFTFLIFLSSLDTSWNEMSLDWVQRAGPLVALWVIWGLLIFHIDQQEAFSPIRFKLLIFCMTLILSVFNISIWITSAQEKERIAARRSDLASDPVSWMSGYQALRLEPTRTSSAGPEDTVYSMKRLPFRMNYDWGSKVLGLKSQFDIHPSKPDTEWRPFKLLRLPFSFEFFGQIHQEIYISELGFVSFEKVVNSADLRFQYGSTPMIIPLFEKLNLSGMSPRTGMYIQSEPEVFQVTWCELHEVDDQGPGITFQLALFPDGSFEIIYGNLDPRTNFEVSLNPWPYSLFGVLPGRKQSGVFIQPLEVLRGSRFSEPVLGIPGRGIVQDNYLYSRRLIHPLMNWEVCTILVLFGVIVLIVSGLVWLVLELPLKNLSQAVQSVDSGNLKTQARVYHRDELGAIAGAFNELVRSTDSSELQLRERRAKLEREVDVRTETLVQEAHHREEAAKRLEEGERALTALMRNLPGVVFRMEAEWEGRVEFISHQAVELFGVTSATDIEKSSFRDWMVRGDMKESRRIWTQARDRRVGYELNYRIRSTNGELKWIREQGRFVEEKDAIFCEGLLLDMSETKRVEQDLEAARLEAEAADQAKSVFVANMSHEIRTPLNSILGYAQILCQSDSLDETLRLKARKIMENGSALLVFINDILDLAKIEAGRMDLVNRQFDLTVTLEGVAERLGSRCVSEGLRWRFDTHLKNSYWVQGDEQKVMQTLSHLLSLSIQRSEYGEISFKAAPLDVSSWGFTIKDTGRISNEIELITKGKSAFEVGPLTSTEKNEALSVEVCCRFVELMKGSIDIQYIQGQGVTTSVCLPLPPTGDGVSLSETLEGFPEYQIDSITETEDVAGKGALDKSEQFVSALKRTEVQIEFKERLMDAVTSGAVTLLDELIQKLAECGPNAAIVAEKMRQASQSYDMKALEAMIQQMSIINESDKTSLDEF